MYSLIIKNVRVVNGLGNPWYLADLGIQGEKIATIGRIETKDADRVIDGSRSRVHRHAFPFGNDLLE
jgi:N-acyl-D-amino-acid deacylase